MTFPVRSCVAAALGVAALVSHPSAQNKVPPPNRELETLHAHFETVVARRHDQLFKEIATAGDWEPRKQALRASLAKMLWHDMRWPDAPPRAEVTGRHEYAEYTVENLVIETAPKLYLPLTSTCRGRPQTISGSALPVRPR